MEIFQQFIITKLPQAH